VVASLRVKNKLLCNTVSNNGTYNQSCTYLKYMKLSMRKNWSIITHEERKSIQLLLQDAHKRVNKILRG